MGDWRNNKDEEVELDGVGGVNILVKADVHRSGQKPKVISLAYFDDVKVLISLVTLSKIKRRRKDLPKWPRELVTK